MRANRIVPIGVALWLCLALLSLTSCGSGSDTHMDQQQLADSIEARVLEIHDEVMPRMQEIESLSRVLSEEIQNTTLDSLTRARVVSAMHALAEGDSLMWDWMHQFADQRKTIPDSLLVPYLQSEEKRIANVRDIMNQSLEEAEKLAQKLGHGQPN